MIVTVTLNAAVDRTLTVPNFQIGGMASEAWAPIPADTPPEPEPASSSANTASAR